MSHTVKVKVQLRNKIALGSSVVELQGNVLGDGTHRLYQGAEVGFGFTLPKWHFPLVLKEGGELAYDDYNGVWGNPADITRLTELYALIVAKQAAAAQGWLTEMTGDRLLVFHPTGGVLTVLKNGTVDADNFIGTGCTGATATLEAAMGVRKEEQLKDEYFVERARVHETA